MRSFSTTRRQRALRSLAPAGAFLLFACTGYVAGGGSEMQDLVTGGGGGSGAASSGSVSGNGGSTPSTGPMDPPFTPAAGLLRRLTRAQFRNVVRDMLGVDVDTQALDPDSYDGSFASIGASSVATSAVGVERYHAAIEAAVEQVFADAAKRAAFVECTPSSADDACVAAFLSRTGRRAFRRPLDAAETAQLTGVIDVASRELGSIDEGLQWATVALLTSPSFLYRPELGTSASDGSSKLDGFETASRLAFLLWNTAPDDPLLDEAARGALDTPAGIREAAQRMLDDPRARELIGNFAEELMRLDRVLSQAKDPNLYPEYGPALQEAAVRDMREVWTIVAFDEDASALEVFSTSTVVVNADLARVYGLDATGLDATTYTTMTLPADGPRAGILAKPGFLAQLANQKEGSPTLRGKFIRETLMCTPVPPPPPNVSPILPEPEDVPMTKRQRLELHRSAEVCASCHGLMDPMGLPLETFDAIGRFRTTDQGLPIDPSGELNGVPVADSKQLGEAMSESAVVADCLVRRLYAYSVGHAERSEDRGVIRELDAAFESYGYRIRPLILDIVSHGAFTSVAPPVMREQSP